MPLRLLRTSSISPAGLIVTALLFSLALAVSPGISQGQDPLKGWQWQNPLPQGNAINSIKFAGDKRHGWAVGGDGVILATTNGGFDWDQQESPTNTTQIGRAHV